jgi:hypothetical protein
MHGQYSDDFGYCDYGAVSQGPEILPVIKNSITAGIIRAQRIRSPNKIKKSVPTYQNEVFFLFAVLFLLIKKFRTWNKTPNVRKIISTE